MARPADDTFLGHLCRSVGIALVGTDAHLRICFWNAAASRLFGGTPEAMLGQPLTAIVPREHRALAQRLLQRALRRGEPSTFEFAHRDAGGSPVDLAISVSPVLDDRRQRIGLVIGVRDVSRRIESERALAQAGKMSALGTMAGGIAHHFNNLLGGIVTTADFAQTSEDPEVLRRALRSIVTALTRASRLTHALLAFAEGDPTDHQPANVTETVQHFLRDLRPRLAERRIGLEADLSPIPASLPAKRLTTILECLTSNACEAMPDGGTLRVELSQPAPGGEVLVRISDTGQGISETELRHAFEPFFTTKASGPPGTTEHPGLGLAVVHGLSKSLGGTVTLASKPGEGTTCSVRIPVSSGAFA